MSAPVVHSVPWSSGEYDVTALSSLTVGRITMERVAATAAYDEVIVRVTGLTGASGWLLDTAPAGFRADTSAGGIVVPRIGSAQIAGTIQLGSQRQPYWRPDVALGAGTATFEYRYRAGDPRPATYPGTLIT